MSSNRSVGDGGCGQTFGSRYIGAWRTEVSLCERIIFTLYFSAVLVEDDADLTNAAQSITINKWVNSGQVCLSPDYVLVHKSLVDKFLQELKTAIEKEYVPSPKQSEKYSRIINERHFQ
jgi:hypothetical protein